MTSFSNQVVLLRLIVVGASGGVPPVSSALAAPSGDFSASIGVPTRNSEVPPTEKRRV
jgi:hypothetical protein